MKTLAALENDFNEAKTMLIETINSSKYFSSDNDHLDHQIGCWLASGTLPVKEGYRHLINKALLLKEIENLILKNNEELEIQFIASENHISFYSSWANGEELLRKLTKLEKKIDAHFAEMNSK